MTAHRAMAVGRTCARDTGVLGLAERTPRISGGLALEVEYAIDEVGVMYALYLDGQNPEPRHKQDEVSLAVDLAHVVWEVH